VTEHPTAEWTTQQFREVLADLHPYRFVIHDRDSIFSPSLDSALNDFGVRILRTPVQAPKANAYCERLVGTIRRECLEYVMPWKRRSLTTHGIIADHRLQYAKPNKSPIGIIGV
jgi:transposase InsO family protein